MDPDPMQIAFGGGICRRATWHAPERAAKIGEGRRTSMYLDLATTVFRYLCGHQWQDFRPLPDATTRQSP
jgi:hypothetical protein